MSFKLNILLGIFYSKGRIVNLLKEGEYYNKYIYQDESKDKFLLYVKNDYVLENNTIISLKGFLENPQKQRNRGGFDNEKYMFSQSFYGSIFVEKYDDIDILETNKFNLINFIQNNIYETLAKLLPKEQLGILLGMIIGDTFYITEEIKNAFKLSGITHLLAVSGSNVTYIILVTKFLFNKIIGKNLSNFITIIMIILFVLISGASPSVVRAGIMAIILILSEILARSPNTISTVAVTAIIILSYNPLIICDIGFVLSFGGTLGILFLNKPLLGWFTRKFYFISENKIFKYVIEMLSVTLSAQIILTPIMMYYFNNISFISILTNLLVGPFTGIITVLGLITYFSGIIYIPLGKVLSYSIYILISVIIWISQICSKVPYGNFVVTTPSILFIITYYSIIYLVYTKDKLLNQNKNTKDNPFNSVTCIKNNIEISNLKREKLKVIKILITVLIIVQGLIANIPKNYVEVNIVDVGQGDCTLVKTNYYNVLIDGGGSENSDYDVGKQVLVPYLLDNTNGVIDVLFISHFHEDHAEGCISILNDLKVKKIIIGTQPKQTELYTQVLEISKQKNIPIITVMNGDSIKIGDITFNILFPNNKIENVEDLNNNSLVMRMDYGDSSILFTGDIEKETEILLIEQCNGLSNKYNSDHNMYYLNNEYKFDDYVTGNNNLLDIDILKVAHHGSKTSSTIEFLNATTPKLALISLSEDNKFGHPHAEVLKRLEKIKCEIYRTDECGEISLKIYKDGNVKILKKINV